MPAACSEEWHGPSKFGGQHYGGSKKNTVWNWFVLCKAQQATEKAQQDIFATSSTRMIARNPILTDRTDPIAMDVTPLALASRQGRAPSPRLQWSLHAPPIGTTAFSMVQDEQRARHGGHRRRGVPRATTAPSSSRKDQKRWGDKRAMLKDQAEAAGSLMRDFEALKGTLTQLEERAQRVGRTAQRPATTQRSSVGQGSAWMRKWGQPQQSETTNSERGNPTKADEKTKRISLKSSFRSRAQAALGTQRNGARPPGWSNFLFHETASCGTHTDNMYGTWKTKNNAVL